MINKNGLTIGLFLLVLFFMSCMGQGNSNIVEIQKDKEDTNETSIANTFIPNFGDNSTQILNQPNDNQIAEYVRNILEDKNGDLWFGTNSYGVCRYNGTNVTYYSSKNGFGGDQVTSMMEDNEGNLWFSTGGGVTKYDGKSFTNYTTNEGLNNSWVWSIIQDSKGVIWAGSINGLNQFDGNKFIDVPLPKSKFQNISSVLSTDGIFVLKEDSKNNIWIGTDGLGTWKYDGNEFIQMSKMDGLSDNNVFSILEDTKGNMWFGTMFGGLNRFDGKNYTHFTDNGDIGNNEIAEIYEDRFGNIWFSSEGYGIYKYDGTTMTNYGKEQGLNITAVQTIYEDNKGRFWVGGSSGLYKLDGGMFINVTKNGPWE